jgi:hypothetical protein
MGVRTQGLTHTSRLVLARHSAQVKLHDYAGPARHVKAKGRRTNVR